MIKHKIIKLGCTMTLVITLFAGCSSPEQDSKMNETAVVRQNEVAQKNQILEKEIIPDLKIEVGESFTKENEKSVSFPIELVGGAEVFQQKSISGFTFIIENIPVNIKSLSLMNSELTEKWLFATNLEGGVLKSSMVGLEKIENNGTVAVLSLDKEELESLEKELVMSIEVTDGEKMYELEEVKLRIKD